MRYRRWIVLPIGFLPMIKKILKWTGIGLLVVLLAGGSFLAHEWYADKPFFANNFYNRSFLKFVLESPEQLTSMGMLDSIEASSHSAL